MTPSTAIPNATVGSLSGVRPVAQLPYFENETIDLETLQREIEWLLDQGANGVTMALVTETLRLTHEERNAIAEAICDGVGYRLDSETREEVDRLFDLMMGAIKAAS